MPKTEKPVEHELDGDTICSWSPWNEPQRPRKETVVNGEQKKNKFHPEYSTLKIS